MMQRLLVFPTMLVIKYGCMYHLAVTKKLASLWSGPYTVLTELTQQTTRSNQSASHLQHQWYTKAA